MIIKKPKKNLIFLVISYDFPMSSYDFPMISYGLWTPSVSKSISMVFWTWKVLETPNNISMVFWTWKVYGTTNADAGAGIGMKRVDSKI